MCNGRTHRLSLYLVSPPELSRKQCTLRCCVAQGRSLGMFKGRNKAGQELQIPFAWLLFSNRHNDGFLMEGWPSLYPKRRSYCSVPSSSEIVQSEESWDDTFRCWSQGARWNSCKPLTPLWLLKSKYALTPFPRFAPSAYLGWPTPAVIHERIVDTQIEKDINPSLPVSQTSL